MNPDRPLVGPFVDTFVGCFVGSPRKAESREISPRGGSRGGTRWATRGPTRKATHGPTRGSNFAFASSVCRPFWEEKKPVLKRRVKGSPPKNFFSRLPAEARR